MIRPDGFFAIAVSQMSSGVKRRCVAAVCISATVAACGTRVVLARPSHNGQLVAYVSDAIVFDGPAHAMYLKRSDGAVTKVFDLPVDNEGASDIVWTSDDRRVGLLSHGTDGAYFRLFESSTGRVLLKERLSQQGVEVRELHFRPDSTAIMFLACPRISKPCAERSVHLAPAVDAIGR